MIEVKNLVKDYGGHLAVDHLSFRVEQGQIYGFLGPNGAGKSTTMNIMTGYLGATEGEVLIDGHDILEEPEAAKKCIGYLPEIPPLYADMTAGEYLKFAASLKKIPKAGQKEAIEEVMELVKITDVKKRLIKNLSKGYRQRVGMAQAILGKPSVIILDEPTVGLDPKQIIEIRDMIKSLGKKHTVILSSHILSEVSAVCDHILIIAHGRLIASGTPENLERRMKGASGLELEVKGQEEDIRAALEEVHGLSAESIRPETGSDTCHVSLQFTGENPEAPEDTDRGSTDIRETLFYTLAGHRLPILSMTSSRASLEEVFLELTETCPDTADTPLDNDNPGRKKGEGVAGSTADSLAGSSADALADSSTDALADPSAGSSKEDDPQ